MHIISRKALLAFALLHPDAYEPLDNWYRVAKSATWQNISEVRQVFPTADAVGKCTVFNIGGNKYRLITKIFYAEQTILIRGVYTHAEYDQGRWKNDC
jgi:mRNA interferase HigB